MSNTRILGVRIECYLSLTKWPTIALETGYSESPDGLSRDADILLNGSDGRIGIVTLVKIEPLGPDVQTPQNGHVEVWTWDKSQSKKVKIGHRKTLFPPPKTHKHRIELVPDSKKPRRECLPDADPPPLYLDDLRDICEDAVMYDKLFAVEDTDSDDETK